MPMYEIDAVIRQVNDDYKEGWEKVRLLRDTIGACLGVKLPKLNFTWDKEEKKLDLKDNKEDIERRKEFLKSLVIKK